MRLDRVLNARMRCPTSEETPIALEWTLLELEAALEGATGELVER